MMDTEVISTLAVTNDATVNISVRLFGHILSFLLGGFLGVEWVSPVIRGIV